MIATGSGKLGDTSHCTHRDGLGKGQQMRNFELKVGPSCASGLEATTGAGLQDETHGGLHCIFSSKRTVAATFLEMMRPLSGC